MQHNNPISYVSRSLSDTEKNFAQIERELLSLIFGTRKYHHFIYARDIEILTDHKPLVTLFEKSIAAIPSPSLQRMRLK